MNQAFLANPYLAQLFYMYIRQENLLAGMLFTMNAEGNLLEIESSLFILRSNKVCDTIGPVDSECSTMYDAKVHVFSDSVPCLGGQAMKMSEIKFHARSKEHLVHYKEPLQEN